MTKILELLKQRRVWAGIAGIISLSLRAFASGVDFDQDAFTDAIMAIVQAISDLVMITFPIWSYLKPRNK